MVRASFRPVPALPRSIDHRRRQRRGGGIGRRAWFRSMWGQPCGGSSPLLGTTLEVDSSSRHRPFESSGATPGSWPCNPLPGLAGRSGPIEKLRRNPPRGGHLRPGRRRCRYRASRLHSQPPAAWRNPNPALSRPYRAIEERSTLRVSSSTCRSRTSAQGRWISRRDGARGWSRRAPPSTCRSRTSAQGRWISRRDGARGWSRRAPPRSR